MADNWRQDICLMNIYQLRCKKPQQQSEKKNHLFYFIAAFILLYFTCMAGITEI